MNIKQHYVSCAILACLVGLPAQAYAHKEARDTHKAKISGTVDVSRRGRISLAPLPVDIYLRPHQKPTVAFTTPCIVIEKMSNGFPPILAFETAMFDVIGNVNESNILPARLEPVCV
ncbi:MAG: hypothetical protein WBX11_15780 [Thiobacillaceae bacterium]